MYRLTGGANVNALWDAMMNNDSFMRRLKSDPSLSRLQHVVEQGQINYDLVKQLLIDCDPTPNRKYFDWILKGYRDGGNHLLEDVVVHMNTTLKKFITLSKRGPMKGVDINKYCGLFGCNRNNQEFLGLYDEVNKYDVTEPSTREKRRQIKKDADVFCDNDQITIIVPKTQEAAVLYGSHTKWCTAATGKNNMFGRYNQYGNLYIIIPKQPRREGEKYQIQFESNSFMNEQDEPISENDYLYYKETLISCFNSLVDKWNTPLNPDDYGRNYLIFHSLPHNIISDLMISSGIDLTVLDDFGRNIAMSAVIWATGQRIEFLLQLFEQHGIIVTEIDQYGENIFHQWFRELMTNKSQKPSDIELKINALQKRNVGINLINKIGKSPVDLIDMNDLEDNFSSEELEQIKQILEEHGVDISEWDDI